MFVFLIMISSQIYIISFFALRLIKKVLDSSSSQEDVYNQTIGDAVRLNIFRGLNTTVISYGQRNTGKSFSMYGNVVDDDHESNDRHLISSSSPREGSLITIDDTIGTTNSSSNFISQEDGIVLRAINDIFMAKQRHATGADVVINVTFIELYNDRIIDLLGYKKSSTSSISTLSGKGLSSILVKSPSHAKQIIQNAFKRKSKPRSHTICTLNVTINPALNRKVTSGKLSSITSTDIVSAKLTLVDLAGTERSSVRDSESSIINKDLFILSQCITALAEKSENEGKSNIHIPYRDSKLTTILRGSLGGNSCTVMVACVSSLETDLEDSLNTLRYAERTRSITNTVKKNLIKSSTLTPAEGAALRRENKVLRSQLLDITKKYQFLKRSRRASSGSRSICSDVDSISTFQDNYLNSPSNSTLGEMKLPSSSQPESLNAQRWRMKFEKLEKICIVAGISTKMAKLDANDEAELISHHVEVKELREQIKQLMRSHCDDGASVTTSTSGLTMDTFDFYEENSVTSGSSLISSSLVSRSLKSVDYIGKTKLMEIEDKKLEARIQEKRAQLGNIDKDNILRMSAMKLKMEKEESSHYQKMDNMKGQQKELEAKIANLNTYIQSLNVKKSTIQGEVDAIERTLQEKQKIYAKEAKDHEVNMNQINQIVDGLRNQIHKLQVERKQVETETSRLLDIRDEMILEKEGKKAKIETELTNLKSEIRLLTQEKLNLFDEVEDLQNASKLVTEYSEEQMQRQQCEEKLCEKTKEVVSMTEELNELKTQLATLEDARKKEKEKCKLELEKCKKLEKDIACHEQKANKSTVSSLSKPPMGILQERTNYDQINMSQQPLSKPPLPSPARMMKRSRSASPARSVDGSVMSAISLSNMADLYDVISYDPNNHDNGDDEDSSSILFGERSVVTESSNCLSLNPEQMAIRMHAHKLLFWANKSIERSKKGNATTTTQLFNDNSDDPFTLSLTKPNNNKSTIIANKENTQFQRGRTMHSNTNTYNNQSRRRTSLSRSRSPSPFIIRHKQGCTCHDSIFSGKAEHTEFFLPRLGLACSCGAEEAALSKYHQNKTSKDTKDPKALSSFLRSWQVSFLHSIGIKTAIEFIKLEKYDAGEIANAMMKWRKVKKLKPAHYKSCLVALNIWSRVAKSVLKKVDDMEKKRREEEEKAFDVINFPMFEVGIKKRIVGDDFGDIGSSSGDGGRLNGSSIVIPSHDGGDYGYDNDDDCSFASISTLGNNVSMDFDDSFSLMEGEYEI